MLIIDKESNSDIQTKKIKYTIHYTNSIHLDNQLSLFQSIIHITQKGYISSSSSITTPLYKYIILQNRIINFTEYYAFKNIQNEKEILKCIYDLTKQIDCMITKEQKCFYVINPKNIWLFMDNSFTFLPTFIYICQDPDEEIKSIKKNGYITFNGFPFYDSDSDQVPNLYISPELKKINMIPFSVHSKTIYYSLGDFIKKVALIQESSPLYEKIQDFIKKSTEPDDPKDRSLECIL